MLIPSIDLVGGKIGQLGAGEHSTFDFSDFEPWIQKFERYPLVHVVDLDAAMHVGSNRELVRQICQRLTCEVGGGISTPEIAREVLALGAKRVVVGSALIKEKESAIDTEFAQRICDSVGRERLAFAVDTKQGWLALSGWRRTVNITAEEAVQRLEPYCSAFLHTHVETEGGMGGFPIQEARDLVRVTRNQLMVGGGIRSMEQVQELDILGVDSVVGMAIYSGVLAV
jgi:phosphoribosylformimino-5-aminoimidazole carboxamide ribotide isomerase